MNSQQRNSVVQITHDERKGCLSLSTAIAGIALETDGIEHPPLGCMRADAIRHSAPVCAVACALFWCVDIGLDLIAAGTDLFLPACPRWPLIVDPDMPSAQLNPGKSHQIVAKETAGTARVSDQTSGWYFSKYQARFLRATFTGSSVSRTIMHIHHLGWRHHVGVQIGHD